MNSARRSSTSGKYHENTDFERTVFVQNFPGYWTYEDRLAIMCRFGTPEMFTRVEDRKHGKCGYVAVFATNKLALQAQSLLDEVAAQDLALTGQPPAIAALQALPRPRQANVLRHWLRMAHGATPSTAQLEQLLEQIAACTTRGHHIHLKVATGHVQRVNGHLQWDAPI